MADSDHESSSKPVQQEDSSLSISMSLSLPISDDNKKEKTEEISEHISVNSASYENDRSDQEIEIFNKLSLDLEIPKDKPSALNCSISSENSIISLNYLNKIEDEYVRGILEDVAISSREESFNVFANVDLDDKSLSNRHSTDFSLGEKNLFATNFGLISNDTEMNKRLKDFEELLAAKDNTIADLTTELDSVREMSNTHTVSTFSTTEYKQLQEEWQEKLSEFSNAVIYKNELIQQLTESLDQSLKERTEMKQLIDELKSEIAELQEKVTIISEEEEKDIANDTVDKQINKGNVNEHLQPEYVKLLQSIGKHQQGLLEELNSKFNEVLLTTVTKNKEMYENEIRQLKEKMELEKEDFKSEISRLKSIMDDFKSGSSDLMTWKTELDTKHNKEMEELRTYFEKKCADLEKNYSEEIFSQQSRKMSNSSSCSDSELKEEINFPQTMGPEGDGLHSISVCLNKKDLINLQNELNSIINKINKCDFDSMGEEDYINLNTEIARSNIISLLRRDTSLKNKSNINDSEIMNQYQEDLNIMKQKYEEDINTLKKQLESLTKQLVCVSSTVQEVANSGDFEIHEVIQSYERRLQEQVSFAKIDIINALEMQIQRLAANESDDEDWPTELLKLRDKFTEKYESRIKSMEEEHQIELENLKEEHHKLLNGALERARRRSLREGDSMNKGENEILKERDTLKRQVSSLRHLLSELLKYFTQCEDELNNTLVDELVKQGFDKNISQTEEDLNLTNSSPTSSTKTSDSTFNITRVHLAPNFSDLINIIENSSTEEKDSKDISVGKLSVVDLKNELGVCLEKLKYEANAILTLSNNIIRQPIDQESQMHMEEKINSLTRKLITETQLKEDLKTELEEAQNYMETLEKERDRLDMELECVITKENALEKELVNAKNRIAQFLESGMKEIVSEGYGEKGLRNQSLDDTMKILSDLQERARNLLSRSRTTADPALLNLIEELCRVSEKIKEDSKKDRYDLLQQIDVADRKYKTTEKFLEEQAMERELERDEYQKKIEALHLQLKEREKDKVNYERIISEIAQLEQHLQEKSDALTISNQKIKEIETERNEAVDKIKELRDIIRDLERQTESKSEEINNYLEAVKRLQCIVEHQENNQVGETSRDGVDIEEVYRHVERLENEVHQLRLQSELAGNQGAPKQLRTELYEIEDLVDKRTKDLESLHSTANTNCSSPSEDVSAREIVLPKSPKKMEHCEVPLQQLARLKEKLIRHSRAEDAAIKRIKDLEMQIFNLEQQSEEATSERECMQKQIQEQLVLISDFEIRLNEQRIRAANIEKQANTSLELKILEQHNEILLLREKIQQKDKAIQKQQFLLTETEQRLRNLENELRSSKDDDLIISMQKEIEELRSDNNQMKKKIQNDASVVPNLVENIISDKNLDIERLRGQLDDTEKLLEEYKSLNLDKKDLQTLSNLKSNGTCLEDLFNILNLSQADQMRRADTIERDFTPKLFLPRKVDDESDPEPEISAIVGPGTAQSIIQSRNSTEISHNKKVHFDETTNKNLRQEIDRLQQLIESKEKIIEENEVRLQLLQNLESKIENLECSLKETEKTLAKTSNTFMQEQAELKEKEMNLGIELAALKLKLEEKDKLVNVLEKDSKRKDDNYLKLSKEKKDMEKEIVTLKNESFKNVDNAICIKNKEISDLILKTTTEAKRLNNEIYIREEEIIKLQMENRCLGNEIDELRQKIKTFDINNNEIKRLQNQLEEKSNEIVKFKKELENKEIQIESIEGERKTLKEKLAKKKKIIKDLGDKSDTQQKSLQFLKLDHKEKSSVIEALNEDADRYKSDISCLEEELNDIKTVEIVKLTKELDEKEAKIIELETERKHLSDLLNEKQKIIDQITEDSQQLHVNLMTIKSKIKEPGNILELGNKLREEQRKTTDLLFEIHELKAQLLQQKHQEMTTSVDEIAGQLKKEIDDSIKIDSNIINAMSDQSLNSISETYDVEAYKKAMAKEKHNKKQLLQHVHALQAKILDLETKLEQQQSILLDTQVQDSHCIEQLRIQLDSNLDREQMLNKIIFDKEEQNKQLQLEIETLKKTIANSNSKSDSTEYKQLPSKESLELTRLQYQYELLQSEKNKLSNELITVRQSKFELETKLKGSSEMLEIEIKRRKNSEEKLHKTMSREKELKERLMQKNLEMETAVDKLSQEKADLSKQKLELIKKINSQQRIENLVPPQTKIPDQVADKILELNNALLENVKLMEFVARLSEDKKQLEIELDRVKNLEKKSDMQTCTSDLIARADYLFAKTLKLESIRKALIFQKLYLMRFLLSHKMQCVVSALPDKRYRNLQFRSDLTPKNRFRAVCFTVISIIRMKYMVRRWRSGVRIAEKINLRHYMRPVKKVEPTHFQVGQPVSNKVFFNLPTTSAMSPTNSRLFNEQNRNSGRSENENGRNGEMSFFGSSPPSKETHKRLFNIERSALNQNFTPLVVPHVVANIADRIGNIQERLGVILDSNSSS